MITIDGTIKSVGEEGRKRVIRERKKGGHFFPHDWNVCSIVSPSMSSPEQIICCLEDKDDYAKMKTKKVKTPHASKSSSTAFCIPFSCFAAEEE